MSKTFNLRLGYQTLTYQELDNNQSILLESASLAYRSASISGTTLKLFSATSTGSITPITHSYEIVSASYSTTSSYALYAVSASHEIILETSSSHAVQADSASFFGEGIVTASADNSDVPNQITFTKDDNTTFTVVIDTGSNSDNYIHNVSFANQGTASNLIFSGSGSAFQGTLDIGPVVTTDRVIKKLHQASVISPVTQSIIRDNLGIPDLTASFYDSSSVDENRIKLFYNQSSSFHLLTVDTGSGGTADTGSLITTASAANNVLTFTKGDSTTFEVTVDTGSLKDGLLSSSAQIADEISGSLNGPSGSFLITASATNNTLTFTKGDSTTFDIIIDTGSLPDGLLSSSAQIASDISGSLNGPSGSFLISASLSGSSTDTVQFYYGDGTNIYVTIDTGSGVAIDTGSFYTGSTVTGNTITFQQGDGTSEVRTIYIDTGSLIYSASLSGSSTDTIRFYRSGADDLYVTINTGSISEDGDQYIENVTYQTGSLRFTRGAVPGQPFDGELNINPLTSSLITTASATNNVVTFTRGDSTTFEITIDTGSGGPDTNSYIVSASLSDSTLTFISGGDAGAFDGTIDLSGISVDEAKKVIFDVQVSGSGGDFVLQKGTPIHIVDNNNGSAIVIAASASVASAMPAHGILMQDIASGQSGTAAIVGEITGVVTSTFNSGDTIYVGATGSYTNVKPTGSNLIQNLGIVKKVDASNGTGQIYGAGRSNDVPNINPGYSWVGNSSWVATPVATSSFYVDSSSYSISSSYAVTASYALNGGDYDLNVTGNTGTGVITDEESFTIVGKGGIITTMSNNELLIDSHGIISESSFIFPVQGTLRTTINGTTTDVDSGLQTSDSPTFAGLTVNGDASVTGTLTTNELVTNIVSQSIAFATGSTIFGDELTDKHQFTGSLEITGSVSVQGTSLIKDIQRNSIHQHKLIISRSNGDGYELEINTGSSSDGTVTRVGTGNGLTGGDITTSGDISVDYLSITTNLIKGASGGDIPETNDEIIFNNGSNAVVTASFSQIDLSIMNDDLDHGVTSVGYSDGLTGSASPITSTGTLRVKYSGDANVILAASNDSGNPVASTDYILTSKQTNNDVEYHSVDDLPFTNNNGTVTSVATTGGIKGGTITSAGTISLDYTTLGNNNFIMSASTITSAEDGDHILIADNSDSDIVRRITRANFVSGIGGSVTSVATNNGLTGGTITTTGTIGLDLAGTDNYILQATAGGQSGDGTVSTSAVIAFSDASNNIGHAFVSELPFSNNQGDITAVNVSQGLYGGGTSGAVSIKPDWSGSADNTLYSYPYRVTSIADDDIIPFHDDSHGTDRTITFANFKNSVGGDITRVNISTDTGITGPVDTTSGDHTQTIGLDLSELSSMAAAVDGTQDEMILLDAGVQKRKLLGGINLGQFNNDQGWTSNTGDITGVTAGLGLGGGGTSGTVTLNVSSSKFITVGSAVHVDLTQADPTSDDITIDDYFFIQDSSRNNYEDKTRKIKAADIKLSAFNDDIGAGTGDITAVNVSQGLTGGGSSGDVSIKPDWSGSADNTLYSYPYRVTSIADDDIIPFHDDSHGTDRTITFANFKSGLPQGDITGVTAGDGLSGGGASGAVSLAVNVDDTTIRLDADTVKAKTAAVADGATTLATGDQIYDFVIGLGYTNNTGDITGVSAGNGLTGGATSGNATVTLGTPGTDLSVSTTNAVTAESHTHRITTTTAGAASTIVATDSSAQITADNFITTSDKRLKSNIEPIKEGLETLKKFVSYEYELNGKQDAGFLAQEVQEHIPYAVNEKEDGYLAMNTKPIIAHIHKAILELDKRLSDIEQKLK